MSVILVCILCLINLFLWFLFFKKFNKLFSTDDIIESTKSELNKMILDVNRNAERNITLIESRINDLKSVIAEVDDRLSMVKSKQQKQKMESAYKKLNIKFLNYDFLFEILLTHELFHHIEAVELGRISDKLEKVDAFKFMHIKKKFPIIKTSDIGANIFTKDMLNLSFHPKVLNYLYLLGTGYTDEENIINYFNELNRNFIDGN